MYFGKKIIVINFLKNILEPVSSTAPKVPPVSARPLSIKRETSVSILCPAQGYPAPNFR